MKSQLFSIVCSKVISRELRIKKERDYCGNKNTLIRKGKYNNTCYSGSACGQNDIFSDVRILPGYENKLPSPRCSPPLAPLSITASCGLPEPKASWEQKAAAPLGRSVKGTAGTERRTHRSSKQIWQKEWRSRERQADVGMEHYIRSVKKLIWLRWHKLLRGPSHRCVPVLAKFTTGFWSPAIMDHHQSREDKEGRL